MERVFDFDELCRGEEFTDEDAANAREVAEVFLFAAQYLSTLYRI